MANLKAVTQILCAMGACLAAGDASGGDLSDGSQDSERGICASTVGMTCSAKHSADACPGLGAKRTAHAAQIVIA